MNASGACPHPGFLISSTQLAYQFPHKLLEDMHVMVDVLLCVLDGDGPLVVEARREEDAAIGEEEPVGIRNIHVDVEPGAIVASAFVAEHGATLRADLRNMHGQVELLDHSLV